ncbi:MAG TPA: hypothetical protein VJS15_09315 [Allosphingosinicella sp.]|nr:hypothetical protein [Allosphingosinicella sp.]
MSLALILAMQAAAPTPAPVVAPIAFDLAHLPPAGAGLMGRGCRADDPAPIVVCGRRAGGGDYPIEQWARIYAVRPLRAERDLGDGAVLGVHSEAVEIAPGLVSNRVMLGLGIRF